MRTLLAAAGLSFVVACSGLYSGPSPKVHRPGDDTYAKELARERDADAAAAKQRKEAQVDVCDARFFEVPGSAMSKHKTGAAAAIKLSSTATDTLTKAGPAPDEPKAADLVVSALAQARSALASDPYSPQATLTLAVAYGRAHRKGCALALLHRLHALSTHPAFSADADRLIEQAAVDPTFEPYRPAALDALGR